MACGSDFVSQILLVHILVVESTPSESGPEFDYDGNSSGIWFMFESIPTVQVHLNLLYENFRCLLPRNDVETKVRDSTFLRFQAGVLAYNSPYIVVHNL